MPAFLSYCGCLTKAGRPAPHRVDVNGENITAILWTYCTVCRVRARVLVPIAGVKSSARCGARCEFALSADCSCECGGERHGMKGRPRLQCAQK